jgi:predicted TPR repeat methyltransferase
LPEEARKQRLLAESYLREKDFKGSIEHYELGVKACATWPEGWFNLALLYGETSEYALAADRMKHYLELMPNSPDAAAARDKIVIWEDKAANGKQ